MHDITEITDEFAAWVHAHELQIADETDAAIAAGEFITETMPEIGADDAAADLVTEIGAAWWARHLPESEWEQLADAAARADAWYDHR